VLLSWLLSAALSNAEKENVALQLAMTGKLELPGDPVWFGPYPGSNRTVTGGVYAFTFEETLGVVELGWEIYSNEPECAVTPDCVANACGIHIHNGKSCDQHDSVGEHYYNTDLEDDPWLPITHRGFPAAGRRYIRIGADQDTSGHTVVVHDETGARIACAVLPY